ncbi:DUF4825 domain-containing protein [Psychrobacter sp. I-STPA6b]|uniref:DUF4825 domain-containing protein n=1 Tax=Psychrobacter sp. I-STPA6b TaxID=2585718 RepID=UPI001D0C7255|nr:DUF4825 domain-containing protein [Psychrobacter sp. I-STPA6b]
MRQKPLIVTLFGVLFVTLVIIGVYKGVYEKETTPNLTTGLFQYKGTYVGNNSAVSHILNNLSVTGYSKNFELETQQAPYGIILNYDGAQTLQQRQKIVVYTATYLFTLIRNVDWITYNFASQRYTISKTQLQNWYKEDLSTFRSEDELNSLIEQQLMDSEKLNQLAIP